MTTQMTLPVELGSVAITTTTTAHLSAVGVDSFGGVYGSAGAVLDYLDRLRTSVIEVVDSLPGDTGTFVRVDLTAGTVRATS